MLLLSELKEKLTQLDEITLLDLLGATSEDLVERFEDVIEDNFDKCVNAIDCEESTAEEDD